MNEDESWLTEAQLQMREVLIETCAESLIDEGLARGPIEVVAASLMRGLTGDDDAYPLTIAYVEKRSAENE